ncbi:MAG: HAMP domain-containing histidine kinase, partial [Spirochaetes bacterium]|nr:HAMP domain-containing histidine kinase [Spirochaetota bacterium]
SSWSSPNSISWKQFTVWDTVIKENKIMNSIKIWHSKIIWIFVLNLLLIVIPVSSYYYIQKGNYQALYQRQMSIAELNRWISRQDINIFTQHHFEGWLVLGPYQRNIIIGPDWELILDSGWQDNSVWEYHAVKGTISKILQWFPVELSQPNLTKEEIVHRFAKYKILEKRKSGVINYRFIYSIFPLYEDNKRTGTSIIIVDKSDIMQNHREAKLLLLLIFLISALFVLIISFVYIQVFIRPLRKLTKETQNLDTESAISPEIFSLKNRNDEIGLLSQALHLTTYKLQKKTETITTFTADILHELKNPLTAIRNSAELLNKKTPQQNFSTNDRELLRIINTETGRIERLLFEIRELNFLENKSRPTGCCNPLEVAEDIVQLYQEHGLKILSDGKPTFKVPFSEDEWARILKNLLDNAVDFSPAKNSIFLSINQTGNEAEIIIADNGSGISDEERKKVFNRFYSKRPIKKQDEIHSGIGLSIVKSLVESRKGTIFCRDNVPQGTKMIICVPVCQVEEELV